MEFIPDNLGVTMKPNPAFVLKVVNLCSPVDLAAFQPPPDLSKKQQQLHMLCPLCSLHTSVERPRVSRQGDQLFISWQRWQGYHQEKSFSLDSRYGTVPFQLRPPGSTVGPFSQSGSSTSWALLSAYTQR